MAEIWAERDPEFTLSKVRLYLLLMRAVTDDL